MDQLYEVQVAGGELVVGSVQLRDKLRQWMEGNEELVNQVRGTLWYFKNVPRQYCHVADHKPVRPTHLQQVDPGVDHDQPAESQETGPEKQVRPCARVSL